ncbi:MAG: iron uptake porin [Spirulina sp. SIO3F2]|nr:iron uptake porin [Spirulina sp. SIO3F2]
MTQRLIQSITASTLCMGLIAPVAQAQDVSDYLSQVDNYARDRYPSVTESASTVEEQLLDRVEAYGISRPVMNQGVGAAQFSDVSPSDWAYQALDDLVRRYDCLKGYPNGTFRGNRALSRYEFAAGLNACMQQIERLIAETTADFVTRDDLEALQRLMQDFEAELSVLGSRVDALESRTSFLEDNAFSTTTKLEGEVMFALTQAFTNDDPATLATHTNLADGSLGTGFVDNNSETLFGHRAELRLYTSFSGEDLLAMQLAAGNLSQLAINTAGTAASGETFQGFNLSDTNNSAFIDWVAYYMPLGDGTLYIPVLGSIWSDNVPTLNPYFEDFDNGNGALSTFATESPIYRIGGNAGFIYTTDLGLPTLSVGYLAGQPNTATSGLFSGDYAMLAQAAFDVSEDLQFGLTYVHGYHPSSFPQIFDIAFGTVPVVGSALANNRGLSSTTNSYGFEAAWQPTDWLSISGFFAYTHVNTNHRAGTAAFSDKMDVWTYGLGFAFPDFGKEGNILGIFAGAQPYTAGNHGLGTSSGVTPSVGGTGLFRNDNIPYHVEAFYKHQLNDQISITPGLIWLSAPNQIDQSALIGTVRTTFEF